MIFTMVQPAKMYFCRFVVLQMNYFSSIIICGAFHCPVDPKKWTFWKFSTFVDIERNSYFKGIPRFHFFRDDEIWDLIVSSLQTYWKTFFWCLLTLRVNKNSISDGFGAISRQNHNGKWWISGENPLFWAIISADQNWCHPHPRKKTIPWSKKYFFTKNR